MPRPPPTTTTSDPSSSGSPPLRFLRQDSRTSTIPEKVRSASVSMLDADLPGGALAIAGELLARAESGAGHHGRRKSRQGSKVSGTTSPNSVPTSPLANEVPASRIEVEEGNGHETTVPVVASPLREEVDLASVPDRPQHSRIPSEKLLNHLNTVASSTSPGPDATRTNSGSATPQTSQLPLKPTPSPSSSSSTTANDDEPSKPKFILNAVKGFLSTPAGLFATIYLLLVIAWGGFLFLILINAAPRFTGEHRLHWIEIASQVVNALFTLTGFGLAPWRFRDLYWLIRAKYFHSTHSWGRICKKNVSWFRPDGRLKEEGVVEEDGRGYQDWDNERGTKRWKLWVVVGLYVLNTLLQVGLSSLMWGMTRFNRPAGAVGALVAFACLAAGGAGGMVWWEGRRLKKEAAKEEEEGEKA
ncbi:hypothetical protein BJ508DRAFT_414372 [Ascobolus immersus RN42]|uniref:Uncharacterized protein n=1 Tax=Ascobolus immersus RN42 TaxID=1160509 RepID=A0A3N4ID25_ASCIM|nr:hypothetical protein BJ508DRAFT_414372 [Ascobolus immersus RN42]